MTPSARLSRGSPYSRRPPRGSWCRRMANFSYQAISENGTTVTGDIEADSAAAAEAILLSRGYIPAGITATGATGGGALLEKLNEILGMVSITDLIILTKQFRSML